MKSRTRFSKKKRGIQCLNCGQPMSHRDNCCSNCGQVNDELPLSIKQFISDFFAGFFNFDSRFFKTFIPLLFKPGKVPKDYIEGKRMKYVNPFQLYLNVTIIFFLMQGFFSALDEYKLSDPTIEESNQVTKDSIAQQTHKQLKEVEKNLANQGLNINFSVPSNDTIQQKKKDTIVSIYEKYIKKYPKDSLLKNHIFKTKSYIDSILLATNTLEVLNDSLISLQRKDSVFDVFFESNMAFIQHLTNSKKVENIKQVQDLSLLKEFSVNYITQVFRNQHITYKIPEKATISVEDDLIKSIVGQGFFKRISDFMAYDNNHENAAALEAIDTLGYKKTRWNVFYFKKAQDLNKMKKDKEFRQTYLDTIISKISVALFFLLPVFTMFLSLLYIRGKKNYTEHLVFVFNVQTVFFILLIFFTLFDKILKTAIGTTLFIPVFLFYLERAMQNFYEQHWIKTIIKFFIVNTIYITLAIIGLIIISFLAFVL
jgi:hypothetical protein